MNSVVEFPEFPDNGQTVSGMKYLVSQDHTINGNVTLKPNVILYFTTGKLIGNGVLTGYYTNIVAPIAQIFGENITVNGTWSIDRAYPQWFGGKIIRGHGDLSDPVFDASDAINKAIVMKRAGEVFMPRGEYMVSKTIRVGFGINLIGEPGAVSPATAVDTIIPEGTIIKPMTEANGNKNSFIAGYIVMVNIKDPNNDTDPKNAKWEVGWPDPLTVIKNINFTNVSANIKGLKCILVGGSFVFESLTFSGFSQGVATAYLYSDLKKITNCVFSSDDKTITGIAAFDLSGLGDALVFEHNAVHGFPYYALKLSGCFAGAITANILNADVRIEHCKGITLTSNHLEGDPQIHIVASNVILNDNYMHKRSKPGLLLECGDWNEMPVVELNNHSFIFLDYGDKPTTESINEYDVSIKGDVILKVNDSYRYWEGLAGKMYPSGILINKAAFDKDNNLIGYFPFNEFNHFSQLLSTSCSIMPDSVVINNSYANNLSAQRFYIGNASDDNKWYDILGHNYEYKYFIIWDYDRKITKTDAKGNNLFKVDGTPVEAKGTVLICISSGNYLSRQVMVRLIRIDTSARNKVVYVDVPLCGTRFFYDNGFSICGYRWKDYTDEVDNEFLSSNSGMRSIKYHGENIECWSNSFPMFGKWKAGDTIYNTGTQSQEKIWIIDEDVDLG